VNVVKHSQAIQILRQSKILNPLRLVKLLSETIELLDLNLSGLTILTEAASGPYVVTPVMAAMAGPKRVLALTGDSKYATADSVTVQTRALEVLCGIDNNVEIYTQRSLDLFAQADIITNLGFIRPIDSKTIAVMKSSAVVPLMCESWEYRPEDVDVEACRHRGIEVLGTNEDYPGLQVFAYSGLLALKMLFEAKIEVYKSKIVVLSSDKFGRVIKSHLSHCGAYADLVEDLLAPDNQARIVGADALIIADYTRDDIIVGLGGDITSPSLAQLAPTITVVNFAGLIDADGLRETGIFVYPQHSVSARRMTMTLAELGPRPVIELHGAGLKVGEIAARARSSGLSWSDARSAGFDHYDIGQVVNR
jgi:hypothetical protein